MRTLADQLEHILTCFPGDFLRRFFKANSIMLFALNGLETGSTIVNYVIFLRTSFSSLILQWHCGMSDTDTVNSAWEDYVRCIDLNMFWRVLFFFNFFILIFLRLRFQSHLSTNKLISSSNNCLPIGSETFVRIRPIGFRTRVSQRHLLSLRGEFWSFQYLVSQYQYLVSFPKGLWRDIETIKIRSLSSIDGVATNGGVPGLADSENQRRFRLAFNCQPDEIRLKLDRWLWKQRPIKFPRKLRTLLDTLKHVEVNAANVT